MSNLAFRQQKIQEKRKQTPWRQFVMEICSWHTLNFYRHGSTLTRFPVLERVGGLADFPTFIEQAPAVFKPLTLGDDFFSQFQVLWSDVPALTFLNYGLTHNCEFADIVFSAKNCYLSSTVITDCENVFYSQNVKEGSRNVFNALMVRSHSEHIYQSVGVLRSTNVFFSKYIEDSSDIFHCLDMRGCHHCINCTHLENKSYCIENIEYSKDQYLAMRDVYKKRNPHLFVLVHGHDVVHYACANVHGGFMNSSADIEQGYFVFNVKRGRNLFLTGGNGENTDMYDVFSGASDTNEHFYGCTALGAGASHVYCSAHILKGSNIFYSYFLRDCSFCLGCIGLTNKSYCILNKQYTKEERYEKVDAIFAQMDKDGTLGDFFPATMNPFYFNDTAAYLIDPSFTKEEVTAKGYLRRDEPIKVDIPAGVQTVKTSDLDQFEGFDTAGNWTISDEILKKVILDEQGNAYRVIPMELEFLRKYGLPLPRKHWLERMKENFRIS